MIAFGGLSWALDGACRAGRGGAAIAAGDGARRCARQGNRSAAGMPAREIRFRNVTFAYPPTSEPVLDGFDLTIPAGSSLAIVGQNGAGKTTLAKLLCRLYDPQQGAIEVDGVDLREPRPRRLAVARDRRISGLHPLRAAAARQRRARRRAGRRDPARAGRSGGVGPGRARHGSGPRLRRRHRSFRRPVAAGRAGPRALCAVRLGRRRRAARRAHRPARRARRGRDLRSHSRRHAAHHDDPDLAPVFDRAPRRSHLRARTRPGGRARHA